MNVYVAVLIAAVTVNCLVTTINGKSATDNLAVPYTDMLLPPLEDVQDNNSKDAATKVNAIPAAHTTTVTTTTKKPITNDESNILSEITSEALLPPLYEAKIEKEEVTTDSIKTTLRPANTKKKTTFTTTTTIKPSYTTTTTLKPFNLKVPDLLLEPLLPPLSNNASIDIKEENLKITTQKPTTTTKSTYHKQQAKQFKDQTQDFNKNYQKQQQQFENAQLNAGSNEVKNYSKPTTVYTGFTDKDVAESKTHPKQVFLTSQQQNVKLPRKSETVTDPIVAKQKRVSNNNYNFDVYFGSTTPRPPKSGLPTITPFPHRLRR